MKLRISGVAVLSFLFLASSLIATTARAQTIPPIPPTITLDLSLDGAVSVNATVSVDEPILDDGELMITGSISGSATIKGISATIPAQAVELNASINCRDGMGTLTLSTSPITVSLSTGPRATIAAQTLRVSATCRRPTLTVTANPIRATISDGAVVSTSRCTVTISSPASTLLGGVICDVQELICELEETDSVDEAISLLNQVLANVTTILTN